MELTETWAEAKQGEEVGGRGSSNIPCILLPTIQKGSINWVLFSFIQPSPFLTWSRKPDREKIHTGLNNVGALRACWHSWEGTDEQRLFLCSTVLLHCWCQFPASACVAMCHLSAHQTAWCLLHSQKWWLRDFSITLHCMGSESTQLTKIWRWKMGAGDLDLWKCYFESNKTWSFSLVTLTVSQRILLHPAAPCSFHWMHCFWGSMTMRVHHHGLWWHNNSDVSLCLRCK